MGKYRIKHQADESGSPERIEDRFYWQERHFWQRRDLDFQEIDDLNRAEDLSPEEDPEPQTARKTLVRLLAIFILIVFVVTVLPLTGGLQKYSVFPFLRRSVELKQNEQIQAAASAVVEVSCGMSFGTGFNLDPSGVIVTNYHVVKDCDLVSITFHTDSGNETYIASRVEAVENVDLAVIYIFGNHLPTLETAFWNGDFPEEVIWIGGPNGYRMTVSEGKIDGMTYIDEIPCYHLQGLIAPGSSGSPVLDQNMNVIGVVFASQSGQNNSGFAIPIQYLSNY